MTSATATAATNGWANWATWNVALWLQNDETLYNLARRYDSYARLLRHLENGWGEFTPDGALWNDPAIDTAALDEMLADL